MKIKIIVTLCFISLVIVSYRFIINKNLTLNDIEKYSKNTIVEYASRSKYGIRSYILNINNNSVVEATKSIAKYTDNKYTEFNGYHVSKIKGIKAIYDADNNIELDLDSVAQKFGYVSYECSLLKYDEINELLYMFIINSHTDALLIACQMKTGQVVEIMRAGSKYNNKTVIYSYILDHNTIYILNDKNELCEYNFNTKEFKNLQIKPKCYSVADEKIIYLDNNVLYEYNISSATIKKLFKLKGFVIDLFVNKNATFILIIEELFWHTEIFDYFLRWPTHNMNCLKIYELSTGKSKVLVGGDRKHYVTSAKFIE